MIWGFIGLFLGGILKGATGAGAPILAVPVLAAVYNVQVAVVLFSVPSLVSNAWQGWRYRSSLLPPAFVLRYAGAGAAGAAAGTVLLANLPSDVLKLFVAVVVTIYIAFRLSRPGWILGYAPALRMALPVGIVGGLMQGSSGVSAPVSVTFLNAMRLERTAFMATISVFFAAMSTVQIPMLAGFGIMTGHLFLLSVAALAPIFMGMWVGAWLARRISREAFDRMILGLLAVLAAKLYWDGLG